MTHLLLQNQQCPRSKVPIDAIIILLLCTYNCTHCVPMIAIFWAFVPFTAIKHLQHILLRPMLIACPERVACLRWHCLLSQIIFVLFPYLEQDLYNVRFPIEIQQFSLSIQKTQNFCSNIEKYSWPLDNFEKWNAENIQERLNLVFFCFPGSR